MPNLVTLLTTITNTSQHRLLLLKLDNQIGGTIYRPTLAANEACTWRGWGATLEGVGYSKHALTCLVGSYRILSSIHTTAYYAA